MNSQPSSSTKEHKSPAIPSGKIILAAVAILLLAVTIFGSGCADVSSSSGEDGADESAGDGGSEGTVTPTDSDSSDEFKPTAELRLSNGATVSARGLEIKKWGSDGSVIATFIEKNEELKIIDDANWVYQNAGTMYAKDICGWPSTMVEVIIKKKDLNKISFSVYGINVSNIRSEKMFCGERENVVIYADIEYDGNNFTDINYNRLTDKKLRFQLTGLFSSGAMASPSQGSFAPLPSIGSMHFQQWDDSEIIVIDFWVVSSGHNINWRDPYVIGYVNRDM